MSSNTQKKVRRRDTNSTQSKTQVAKSKRSPMERIDLAARFPIDGTDRRLPRTIWSLRMSGGKQES